ncbi:MAG: hypothetical protein ABI682_01850 [Acidobacteriota bacterium]
MTASASVPMSGHYGTETTKMKNVTEPELRVGDSIHFDYTEKDGEMWLTELSRTHKPRS